MSYYKYLYESRNSSKNKNISDNTYTYIGLAIIVFLLITGLLFYLNRPTESEALRNERIRRKELDNMYYA